MAARSTTPASGTAQPAGVFGPLQDEVLGRMFGADRRRMRELEERLAEERRKRENVERRLAVSEFRLDEQQSALWKREAETSEREAEMMPECADHDADRRGRLNA
jgi:hypothetical protein